MPATRDLRVPIDYERYRAEAARLRGDAVAEAFGRLRRLFRRREATPPSRRPYGALGAAGCGQ